MRSVHSESGSSLNIHSKTLQQNWKQNPSLIRSLWKLLYNKIEQLRKGINTLSLTKKCLRSSQSRPKAPLNVKTKYPQNSSHFLRINKLIISDPQCKNTKNQLKGGGASSHMDSLRVQWVIPMGWRSFSRHEYSGFVHGALGRSVLFRGCGGEHRSLITQLTNSSRGRGCRHGNEVAGTSSILLVSFSRRCQGRLRCGTVRTLTGTHLWHKHTNISSQWFVTTTWLVRTNSVQWCTFAEEQTGPRFRFVLWLWFDKPTHTYFVRYITLPVRKDDCNRFQTR